jgi:hypothetical protein
MKESFVLWLKISAYSLTVVIGMRLASPAMQNDPRVKDFEARVTQYLNLRKKEAGSSPGATKSPDKLSDNQEQLAARVKALRPDAKQGDIFTPEIAEYFRRQLSSTLAGPDGTKIRASLRHAEPVRGLSLRVNEVYPQGIPLQSTPPSLLLNVPPLPKELEYRIVGRNLLIRDIAPNLIVDFISDALPSTGD